MDIRDLVLEAERLWQAQPYATLACAGYADEHWQVWHPDDMVPGGMPTILLHPDGTVEAHPDGRGWEA